MREGERTEGGTHILVLVVLIDTGWVEASFKEGRKAGSCRRAALASIEGRAAAVESLAVCPQCGAQAHTNRPSRGGQAAARPQG